MDSDDGRVTLAILSTKLDHLLERIDEYHRDAEENAAAIRVAAKETEEKARIDAEKREQRIRCLEDKVGRIEERQGTMARLQAAFTAVAALIAGWFGSR